MSFEREIEARSPLMDDADAADVEDEERQVVEHCFPECQKSASMSN